VRLLVIGAGGHAKVVIDAARCTGFEIAGVVGSPDGVTELLGIPVSHDAEQIEADGFIVAIGDNGARASEFDRRVAEGMNPATVVHPSAVIADGVTVGRGAFVAAGVVVNVDATIGDDTILNTGCTIDHDCVVGAHSLIGPNASLCGAASVGAGALVGAGASVAPCTSVGVWSVVGAGAAVVDSMPANRVCVGVPARPTREIGLRR